MSAPIPPKRATKVAAKKRAQIRKRNREIGRQVFAYAVIAILIISTVSTVLVTTIGSTPAGTTTSDTPTPDNSQSLKQLVDQGDQAVTAGNYISATQYYNAYLQFNGTDATVHLKYAQALLKLPSPDYIRIAGELQQAINIPNSPVQQDASKLLNQIQPQVQTALATTPTAAITGTRTLTATVLPASPTAIGTSPPANR